MMKCISVVQVRQVVRRRRNLRKISFVAHSLGGLVTRYAIGKLYEPPTNETSPLDTDKLSDEQETPAAGKIAGLEPINFITSATPHLGSRWNKQVSFMVIHLREVVNAWYIILLFYYQHFYCPSLISLQLL
jgi:hypothetical protein